MLSSHQLNEVEHLCDRIAILRAGQLIAPGSVQQLVGSSTRVFVRVQGEVATAAALLLGHGVPVMELRPYTHTLEDVFLHLVQQPSSPNALMAATT